MASKSAAESPPPRLQSSPEFSSGNGAPLRLQHARAFAKSMTLTEAPTVPELGRRASSISTSTTDASTQRLSRKNSHRSSKASRSSTDFASKVTVPIIETEDADPSPIICIVTEPDTNDASVQLGHSLTQANEDALANSMRREISLSDRVSVLSQGSTGSQVSQLGPLDGPARQTVDSDNDYLNYLLSRKFSSSNFIQKMDSKDIVWMSEQKEAKFIGPYLMGEVIGKGSFGKVKEALCSETLARVAIKILQHKRLRKMQNGVESITKEIKLLQRIRHPNCVRLIDVFCKTENPDSEVEVFPWIGMLEDAGYTILKRYLIFEHCISNVQSLLESAPLGQLPLKQCQDYFAQLVQGLEYLHSHHIVHRDIKPGNLLLTADGIIKISDFGVTEKGSMYTKNLLCQTFAGTHQFLSPEVTTGDTGIIGDKIDVWAAAVTLYYMWTGTFPFKLIDHNIMALYEQIQSASFDVPENISDDMLDLFNGMLRKDIGTRMSAQQVLNHKFVVTLLPDTPYMPITSKSADITQLPRSLFTYIEPMFLELASMKKLAAKSEDMLSEGEKISAGFRITLGRSSRPQSATSPKPRDNAHDNDRDFEARNAGGSDTPLSPTSSQISTSRPQSSIGGSLNLTPFSSNNNISRVPRRSSIASSCTSVGMLGANSVMTDASSMGSQQSLEDRKTQRRLRIAIFGR